MTCEPRQQPYIPCDAPLERHHEVVAQLLPTGFAWDAVRRPGTVMYGYWRAVARTFKWFTDEVCKLIDELFCSTRNVLAPDYDIEFGLPDPCSTFLTPCEFLPVEDAHCDALATRLARMGWDIECTVESVNWSAGCAATGCASASSEVAPKRLVIIVHTDTSPVYVPVQSSAAGLAVAGCSIVGCENTSPGTIAGLRCVIDNFLPAHLIYALDAQP